VSQPDDTETSDRLLTRDDSCEHGLVRRTLRRYRRDTRIQPKQVPTETDHEPVDADGRSERVASNTRVSDNGWERNDEYRDRVDCEREGARNDCFGTSRDADSPKTRKADTYSGPDRSRYGRQDER